MNELVWTIAEEVVSKSGRHSPGDAVLRTALKRHRGLPKWTGGEVSRLVFAWQRWRGWLNDQLPIKDTLPHALELQERYNERPLSFSDDELAARAVPEWTQAHVKGDAEWIRSLQQEPRLWLRARRGQGKRLAESLEDCWVPNSPALADAVAYSGSKDLFQSPKFHAGEFEVQDISSQAVGVICGPSTGEMWWDACAGEGGKTLHLSDLMMNKGLIWATDRAGWRLKRLKLRARRARVFNYRSALWDGGTRLPARTKFDGVLVDAPCSGLGTWQKNPHARWTTLESDVVELARIQRELLAHAANAVKPEGKLIYAVCTLTEAETANVMKSFDEDHPEFQPLLLSNPFRATAPVHGLWLWPQETGGNGMFVAAWRRKILAAEWRPGGRSR